MKDIGLLVWLTQLGISVISPLVGFTLLAIWLHNSYGWGRWVIWAGIAVGVICAVDGLRSSLRTLEKLSRNKKKDEEPGVPAYNDHD